MQDSAPRRRRVQYQREARGLAVPELPSQLLRVQKPLFPVPDPQASFFWTLRFVPPPPFPFGFVLFPFRAFPIGKKHFFLKWICFVFSIKILVDLLPASPQGAQAFQAPLFVCVCVALGVGAMRTAGGQQEQGNVRDGDWFCSSCNAHCFASRLSCFR